MADAFFFQIDWNTVAMVIGMLVAIVAVLFYGRRDLN
jgi:Na+/H+ antiporter NhaD/arsenite permease-like protein